MPVGFSPYVDKIYKSNQYLETMFDRVKGDTLAKRDLERLGIMFPAGPRYRMLPYELPEHFDTYSPSGPDIIDIVHERYMKEQKRLREEKENELK